MEKKYLETWFNEPPGKNARGFIVEPLPICNQPSLGGGAIPTMRPEQVIVTQEHGRVNVEQLYARR